MSTLNLTEGDLFAYLRGEQWAMQEGFADKHHAIIADTPYFLGSIVKRFGGKNAAVAKFGKDGSFGRLSKGFMGKSWDGFDDVWEYQYWVSRWAELMLDFVYPGATLAMFGGTRTYHRLTAGLEDAGWEIFDSAVLFYSYGSGFPKAADTGKLIDKSDSEIEHDGEWDGFKTALKPAYEPIVLARAPRGAYTYAELAQNFGTGSLNIDGCRIPVEGEIVHTPQSNPSQRSGIVGSDLGFSGADIEKFRAAQRDSTQRANTLGRYPSNIALACACEGERHDEDCPVRLMDEQSGERKAGGSLTVNEPSAKTNGIFNGGFQRSTSPFESHNDSGGASRFFYTAKAPKWEREAGLDGVDRQQVGDGRQKSIDNAYQRGQTPRRNTHPTVKPVRLIQWLATLLLPPPMAEPRRVLVPFAGSGSEMIGCHLAGWNIVNGVEREAEYAAINRLRAKWWQRFDSYEAAREYWEGEQQIVKAVEQGQLSLF